jgi:Flp pilus assembly pilin Flp
VKNAQVSGTNKLAATIAALSSGALLIRDEGQTLAEYALILTLIAVAVVMAVVLFGGKIGSMWSSINDTFQKF